MQKFGVKIIVAFAAIFLISQLFVSPGLATGNKKRKNAHHSKSTLRRRTVGNNTKDTQMGLPIAAGKGNEKGSASSANTTDDEIVSAWEGNQSLVEMKPWWEMLPENELQAMIKEKEAAQADNVNKHGNTSDKRGSNTVLFKVIDSGMHPDAPVKRVVHSAKLTQWEHEFKFIHSPSNALTDCELEVLDKESFIIDWNKCQLVEQKPSPIVSLQVHYDYPDRQEPNTMFLKSWDYNQKLVDDHFFEGGNKFIIDDNIRGPKRLQLDV